METPSSTQRTQNWSKDEVLLLRLVKERKNIIKGKFSPILTIKHKREAWRQITQALNAAFPACERHRDQVEKKWQNLLCKGKKDIYIGQKKAIQPNRFVFMYCAQINQNQEAFISKVLMIMI